MFFWVTNSLVININKNTNKKIKLKKWNLKVINS